MKFPCYAIPVAILFGLDTLFLFLWPSFLIVFLFHTINTDKNLASYLKGIICLLIAIALFIIFYIVNLFKGYKYNIAIKWISRMILWSVSNIGIMETINSTYYPMNIIGGFSMFLFWVTFVFEMISIKYTQKRDNSLQPPIIVQGNSSTRAELPVYYTNNTNIENFYPRNFNNYQPAENNIYEQNPAPVPTSY